MVSLIEMNIHTWLKSIKSAYDIRIIEESSEEGFISRKYKFSDPYSTGLTFEIFCNEKGEPSLFTTDVFPFDWLNIAESIQSDDILKAAEMVLSGQLKVKTGLLRRKYQLILNLGNLTSVSKPVVLESADVIEGYRRGYTKFNKPKD